MTALPPALARWRRQLEPFPDELACVLGKLLQRLAPAVDAFAASRPVELGEMDGFDGIGNRGSYERLLPTEWLLREKFPLEFLRRAANVEHAFFRLAQREPAPRHAMLVLFDAGPDQLGGCRLAQLAILLLLVQRAEQRGVRLDWQLLHHLGEAPLQTLDAQSVRTFLGARTALRSSARAVESWRAQFSRHELWLVGSEILGPAAAPRAVHVAISERVSPDEALLDVTFRGNGSSTRSVALELPEPRHAVRLLRNPFEVPRAPFAPSTVPGLASNLLFNEIGTKLAYRDVRGDLRILPVPSKLADVGSPWCFQVKPGKKLISATAVRRRVFWIDYADGVVSLRSNDTGKSEERLREAKCREPLVDAAPSIGPMAWFPDAEMATFVAPDRSLWRADFRTNVAMPIALGVRSCLIWRERPYVVVEHWLEQPGAPAPKMLELARFNAHPVFASALPFEPLLLRGVDAAKGKWLLGLAQSPGTYRVQLWEHAPLGKERSSPERCVHETILHAPSGSTVVAVDRDSQSGQLGLVALDEARRELFVVGRSHARTLLKTPSDIGQIAVAAAAPIFAVATDGGELTVLDRAGSFRLRKQIEGR